MTADLATSAELEQLAAWAVSLPMRSDVRRSEAPRRAAGGHIPVPTWPGTGEFAVAGGYTSPWKPALREFVGDRHGPEPLCFVPLLLVPDDKFPYGSEAVAIVHRDGYRCGYLQNDDGKRYRRVIASRAVPHGISACLGVIGGGLVSVDTAYNPWVELDIDYAADLGPAPESLPAASRAERYPPLQGDPRAGIAARLWLPAVMKELHQPLSVSGYSRATWNEVVYQVENRSRIAMAAPRIYQVSKVEHRKLFGPCYAVVEVTSAQGRWVEVVFSVAEDEEWNRVE